MPAHQASSSATPSIPASTSDAAPLPPDPLTNLHQETDVWYGGYAGRTMWVSFLVCIALSLLVQAAAWYFWSDMQGDQRKLLLVGDETLIAAIWLFQLTRWGYRKLAVGVRLTTRRLFYDRGLHYTSWSVIPLAAIARVEVRQNAVERRLRIGRLELFVPGKPEPALVIVGLADPVEASKLIRGQAAKAKAKETGE